MRTVDPRLAVGSTAAPVLLAGVLAVLLAGLLTGCGGSPEPQPLPKPASSTSPSASASTSAVPNAPVMPAAAKAKTDQSVEVFARHYVDIINFATATGNRSDLDALAEETCASCRRISSRLEQIYTAGGSITSEGWRVTAADVVPDQPLQRKYIDMSIVQSRQTLVEEVGASPKTFPGGKQALTMLLARRGDSWVVTRMTLAG